MDSNERLREVSNLRFAFQSKSRLRLEFLGELSKILRIHGQTVSDSVLSSLVVAIPEELPGEGFASIFNREIRAEERPPTTDRPPEKDQRPPTTGQPDERPPTVKPAMLAETTMVVRPPTKKAGKKKSAKTKPAPKKYFEDDSIQINETVTDATQHLV